jgi:hypothetical protein
MEHYLEDIEESNNKSYPGGKMATVFHLVPKLRMLHIIVMHALLHTSVA